MKKFLTGLLLAAAMANPVSAASLKMGTGTDSGTYKWLGNDIHTLCMTDDILGDTVVTDHTLEIIGTEGAIANLNGMSTKQFNTGIVQEDILKLYSKFISPKKVNEKKLKVITPLHLEPINLLIPKGYKPKGAKKSFFSNLFSKDEPKPLDINLLKNQQVGAWGGSMVSAQAMSRFLNLNMSVKEIPEGSTGNIPLIVVAGFPSSIVQNYLDSGKYHLVSIDYDKVKTQADFYVEHKLSYTVNGKVVNVDTIATRALLIGKASRKPSRNLAQQELATCIADNLVDLADDDETNPNWEEVFEFVDDENTVDWDYFDLIEE